MDRQVGGGTPSPGPPIARLVLTLPPRSPRRQGHFSPRRHPNQVSYPRNIPLWRCLTPATGRANWPAAGGRSHSWLCCAGIAEAQHGSPCGEHRTSRVELPVAKLLRTGPCSPPLMPTLAGPCSRMPTLAGPCSSYATHMQGRVPPLISHSHRAGFSLVPHTCGTMLPLSHTLAGPCSPFATHLQDRVPLMSHTCRAVFPLCHTLAGPCSPYATHLRGRVPLMPLTSKAVFLCHTLTGPSCQVARTKLSLHFFIPLGI